MCGVYKCKKIPSYLKWWLFVQRNELPPLLAPWSESTFQFLVSLSSPRCPYCPFSPPSLPHIRTLMPTDDIDMPESFFVWRRYDRAQGGRGAMPSKGGYARRLDHTGGQGAAPGSQRCKDVYMLIWWPLYMWQIKNILACNLLSCIQTCSCACMLNCLHAYRHAECQQWWAKFRQSDLLIMTMSDHRTF